MENYLTPQGVNTTTQDFSLVRNEGYNLTPTRYIGDAFSLFGKGAGSYIGYIFVLFLIGLGSAIFSLIPFVGQLVGLGYQLMQVAFIAGFFIYAHNNLEHGRASFNSFFGAFQRIGPLILMQLIQSAFFFGAALIILVPFFAIAGFGSIQDFVGTHPDNWFNGGGFGGTFALLFMFVGFSLFVLYLLWSLAPMLIILNGLEPWEAMQTSRRLISKNLLGFLGLGILLLLLNFAGILFLLVGALVTFPVTQIAFYLAYRDVCFQNDPEFASGGGSMRFGAHDPDKPLDFEL